MGYPDSVLNEALTYVVLSLGIGRACGKGHSWRGGHYGMRQRYRDLGFERSTLLALRGLLGCICKLGGAIIIQYSLSSIEITCIRNTGSTAVSCDEVA